MSGRILGTAAGPALAVLLLGLVRGVGVGPEPVSGQGMTAANRGCRSLPDSLAGAHVVDDADSARVEVTAYWVRVDTATAPGAYEGGALHDAGGGPDGVVRFLRPREVLGRHEVLLCVPPLPGTALATNAPVQVRHADGSAYLEVDQRARSARWVSLGVYRFERGAPGFVAIRNDAADGHVVADVVAFRPAETDSSGAAGAER